MYFLTSLLLLKQISKDVWFRNMQTLQMLPILSAHDMEIHCIQIQEG